MVSVVGSLRHARADRARPAGASQRARAWRRRPAVVALLDLQPSRDRSPPALSAACHQLQERLRLRQRAVSGRRRGYRGGQRAILGGFRAQPDPRESRHDVEQRAAFGSGARRECRDAARARRRPRAPDRAVRQRQHQSRRRYQFVRRGHGQVAARPARGGPARRRLARCSRQRRRDS